MRGRARFRRGSAGQKQCGGVGHPATQLQHPVLLLFLLLLFLFLLLLVVTVLFVCLVGWWVVWGWDWLVGWLVGWLVVGGGSDDGAGSFGGGDHLLDSVEDADALGWHLSHRMYHVGVDRCVRHHRHRSVRPAHSKWTEGRQDEGTVKDGNYSRLNSQEDALATRRVG